MASVVHRRYLSAEEARRRRPARFPATMSPVGWVSGAVAVAWTLLQLQPLTQFGALDAPRWGDDALLVIRTLGDAAVMALPAGLALGFRGARRANPWLFWGMVLLALAQLARPLFSNLASWMIDTWDPTGEGLSDPSSPISIALRLVSLGIGLLAVGGALGFSVGLRDAGARPARIVVIVMAAAGALVAGLILLPGLPFDTIDWLAIGNILSLLSIALSLLAIALWFVISARLAVGWATRLSPRRAWVFGGAAGALLLVARLGQTLLSLVGGSSDLVDMFQATGTAVVVIWSISWLLLLAALALGLGRGRRVRRHQFFEW